MAKSTELVVNVSVDTSRFHAQIDSLLEPITWRHRLVEWLARQLGVTVEVKRNLRGFRRNPGGFI